MASMTPEPLRNKRKEVEHISDLFTESSLCNTGI